MPNSNPYLIQRLVRKNVSGHVAKLRFGEVFTLEYMGSAEYEFGAFPKYLRAMNAAAESGLLVGLSCTIGGRKVFAVYDSSQYEGGTNEVAELLDGIAKKKFKHKESTYFTPDRPLRANDDTVAWADISNNSLFWSYENLNTSIIESFKNSVKFMDEQKAKSN